MFRKMNYIESAINNVSTRATLQQIACAPFTNMNNLSPSMDKSSDA